MAEQTHMEIIQGKARKLVEMFSEGHMVRFKNGYMVTILLKVVGLWNASGSMLGYVDTANNEVICMLCDPCDLEQFIEDSLED
ncbi:hypothetical protein MZD04_gp033 [Pseudomonas phage Psa21]|uniref:Uncharacterized protein n=1 Tax=Pseudomonas phage Psa21 TaxID=2530023 RepID=A0A481W598_9CAUD|nr:hypothetical protein MZD04_gp033 [Pseudomonas phage Psa21]QBJ02563.1 hypothetical protein PSA21_33 [Pseudomonas phage Psa21]